MKLYYAIIILVYKPPFEGGWGDVYEYIAILCLADVYLKEVLQHLQKKRKSDKKLSDFFINQPKL